MNLTILGSGGALITPRPSCKCRVCAAARTHGGHHWRSGPSLFVHDAHLLVDAPEDIAVLLNREGIDRVDHLFVTHWHPDHSAGCRIVEQLSWDLATGGAKACIQVWLNATTAERQAEPWQYFERKGYCRINLVASGTTAALGPLKATWFNYAPGDFLSGVLLEDDTSRVILALDETKGLADHLALERWAHNCDLAVVECGWFDQTPDGHRLGPADAAHRLTEAGFDRDTVPLLTVLEARRAVLVHINGDLVGRTPTELTAETVRFPHLAAEFAYDGLRLTTKAPAPSPKYHTE